METTDVGRTYSDASRIRRVAGASSGTGPGATHVDKEEVALLDDCSVPPEFSRRAEGELVNTLFPYTEYYTDTSKPSFDHLSKPSFGYFLNLVLAIRFSGILGTKL